MASLGAQRMLARQLGGSLAGPQGGLSSRDIPAAQLRSQNAYAAALGGPLSGNQYGLTSRETPEAFARRLSGMRSGYAPSSVGGGQSQSRIVGGGTVGGGTVGGGYIPGQTFSMPAINIPPQQPMAPINIDIQERPKAPPVERLTYDQLMARVRNDPGYLQELAGLREERSNALDQIGVLEQRSEKDLADILSDITNARDDSLTTTRNRYAGQGGGPGNLVRANELGQIRTEATQAEGRATTAQERLLQDYQANRERVNTGFERNRGTALQNAANRYLARRVTPTEITY